MKSFFIVSLVLVSMSFLVSCGGGGGGKDYNALAQDLVSQLNSTAGWSEYVVVKAPSNRHDFVVIYDYADGNYQAINLEDYHRGMDLNSFYNSLGYGDYIVDLYVDYDYYGYPTGNYSDGYYTYEKTTANSKDLEKIGAFLEAKRVYDMGNELSSQYGLSNERAQEVAKIVVEVDKISKERSITEADADSFLKDLIGTDVKSIKDAQVKKLNGDNSGVNALIDKAAEVNDISPETANSIFQNLFNK